MTPTAHHRFRIIRTLCIPIMSRYPPSGCRLAVGGFATPSWVARPGMAVTAGHSCQVSQIDGVSERFPLNGDDRRTVFFLAEDRMADVTLFLDDLPFSAHMLAVVAPEAAREIEVADIRRMGQPIHFHLGEEVRPEDALDLGNGLFNRLLSLGVQVRVLGKVEGLEVCRSGLPTGSRPALDQEAGRCGSGGYDSLGSPCVAWGPARSHRA